jgi:hypothetical protein
LKLLFFLIKELSFMKRNNINLLRYVNQTLAFITVHHLICYGCIVRLLIKEFRYVDVNTFLWRRSDIILFLVIIYRVEEIVSEVYFLYQVSFLLSVDYKNNISITCVYCLGRLNRTHFSIILLSGIKTSISRGLLSLGRSHVKWILYISFSERWKNVVILNKMGIRWLPYKRAIMLLLILEKTMLILITLLFTLLGYCFVFNFSFNNFF